MCNHSTDQYFMAILARFAILTEVDLVLFLTRPAWLSFRLLTLGGQPINIQMREGKCQFRYHVAILAVSISEFIF